MPLRIDIPSSAYFSDSYGNKPYESKYSKPISAIRYADTLYLARSNGLTATWYRSPDYTNTAYTGVLPGGIVKFWNNNGYPPEVGNISGLTGWSLKLSGYWKSHEIAPTGTFKFYFGGSGTVDDISLYGVSIIDKELSLNYNDTFLQESSSFSVINNNWYPIEIKYSHYIKENSPSGLVILFNNMTSQYNNKMVLSAGFTARSGDAPVNGSMPINYSTVNGYFDTQLNIRRGDASQFSFSVPFISSANYGGQSGFWQSGEDTYKNSDSVYLKEGRLIEYFEGYRSTSDSDEFVQKFTGFIESIDKKYDSGGNDILNIVCLDSKVFTKRSLNLDSPNIIDYIAAGYTDKIPGHVNGNTKPRCFDGWEINKVYETCLINSYIDPYFIYSLKEFTDRDGQLTNGDFKIKYTSSASSLYLPIQDNYGNPTNSQNEDDEYLNSFSSGEFFHDIIDDVLSAYNFDWGIDRKGYPYLETVNVPTDFISAEECSASGAWTETMDLNCLKGIYSVSSSEGDYILGSSIGSRIDAIFQINTDSGPVDSATGYTTKINLYNSSRDLVSSVSYNLYYDKSRSYYDGLDADVGYNPTIFSVATNLPYDTYYVKVIQSDSYNINFDGFLFYDKDFDTSKFKFKTSDNITPGHIVELDVEESIENQRTECVVVGSRTGTKFDINEEYNTTVINPNNQISTFYTSRAVDLNSLHSASATNFSRPNQTIIIDPAIINQDQADYIAESFIESYRKKGKSTKFKTLGNPLLEIGDCIYVSDDHKDGITENTKLWIDEITTGMNEEGYLTYFTAKHILPITSYFEKPEPNLDNAVFNNQAIQNVSVKHSGEIYTLYSSLDWGDENVYVDTTHINTTALPTKGYLHIFNNGLRETIRYDYYVNAAFPYFHVATAGYSVAGRYLQRSTNPSGSSWSAGATVLAVWDPYIQDTMGIVPIIQFDCLVNGKIQVQINGLSDNTGEENLTTLTGRQKEDWPFKGYDPVIYKSGVTYTWNGNDDIGKWNKYNSTELKNLDQTGGFFATEGQGELYCKYKPQIIVKSNDGTIYKYGFGVGTSYGYMRRGVVSSVYPMLVYEGVKYYNCAGTEVTTTDPGQYVDSLNWGHKYNHIVDRGDCSDSFYFPDKTEVFNTPECNDGLGVKINIKDYSDDCDRDPFYKRFCTLNMKGNVQRMCGFGPIDQNRFKSNLFGPDHYKGNITINQFDIVDIKTHTLNFYNNNSGINYYFNPSLEKKFSFYDPELYNEYLSTSYPGYQVMFQVWNYVFFTGDIRDKSGRQCLMNTADSQILNYLDDLNSISLPPDFKETGFFVAPDYLGSEGVLRGNYISWIDPLYTNGNTPRTFQGLKITKAIIEGYEGYEYIHPHMYDQAYIYIRRSG